MNIRRWMVLLLVVLGSATGAFAIDRGARLIDTVSLDMANLDDADVFGGSLWGETTFAVPNEDWALLAGLGGYETAIDYGSDARSWFMGLGLKYYVLPLTSISAVGVYTRNDRAWWENSDTKAGTLTVKQRFLDANEPVSPYLRASYTWRERSTFSSFDPAAETDMFSEDVVTVAAGAEFAMNNDLSFVFDVGMVMAEASDDGVEDLDGFVASVGMQYYWWPSQD